MNQERIFATQLQRLWVSARRRVVLLGLLKTAAVALPAGALAVWVAGAPHSPGQALLWGLGLSVLGLVLMLVGDQVIAPWLRLNSPRALARRIEVQRRCRNLVLTAEDAEGALLAVDPQDPVSRVLLQRVMAGAVGVLQQVRINELLPLRHGRRVAAGVALGVALLVAMGVNDPHGLARGARRLAWPAGAADPVFLGGLYLEGGPDFVVAGQSMNLSAVDFGSGDDAAVCQIRTGKGNWTDLSVRPLPVTTAVVGVPGPYRRWGAETAAIGEDFRWRFRRGSRLTAERSVHVRHFPLLANLAGRIIPPAYMRVPSRVMDILPAVSEVPVGGVLRISGTTNEPVTWGGIALSGGDTLALAVDSLTVGGELTITDPVSFQILLQDAHGLSNQNPMTYQVTPLPDMVPSVRLQRPDDDGILPLGGQIRLVVEAVDDYGLRNVKLMLRPPGRGKEALESGRWQGGVIWPAKGDSLKQLNSLLGPWQVRLARQEGDAGALQARLELVVDLARLELDSGDGVDLVAVARDNQEPGDGQAGWSDVLHLVLPSAGDVLKDQAQERYSRQAELEDAKLRTRKLGQDLERLTRELLKNPTPDWAKQQEMQAAIARRRDLQKQLAELSSRLQQELDRLAANQMTSERQLDQADQISALLEKQDAANLDDILNKIDNQPEALSPQDVSDALQEVANQQQDLARRMDAALAMLKQMDQEQTMEGMTALLEKIMQEQQKLSDQSKDLADNQEKCKSGDPSAKDGKENQEGQEGEDEQQAKDGKDSQDAQDGKLSREDQKSAEDLAARQQKLAEDLAKLEEQMAQAVKEAQEKQQEGRSSPAQQQMQENIKDALDQLKQQQSQDKMTKAGEQLAQMDPEQAAKMQEQALHDLGSLYHVLLKTQEAMQMAMQQHQVKSLRTLAADMLDLSERQEAIAQSIPADLRDARTREVARSQFRMQQVAMEVRRKLSDLSGDAPLRILALLKKLDSLIKAMGYGVNALEEGQGSTAQHHSRDALYQANKIVIGLLTEAQMNSQGGGSCSQSKPSLAEKLMKMLKEQAGLNGLTEELRKMLANRGLSQETRAQMKRLGDAQGDLAGRMEDLAKQEQVRPDKDRLLGDLAQLGKDMESVTDDIDGGLVTDETLRRQERILSRMLDARNSVRQRDYSMRRESRTAEKIYGDPQKGSLNMAEDQRRFLLRYQSLDSAPADYQGLVRRYFSALDSLQRQDASPLPRGVTP